MYTVRSTVHAYSNQGSSVMTQITESDVVINCEQTFFIVNTRIESYDGE